MKKLYVFCKDIEGQTRVIETTDYATKKDCKQEYEANEFTVYYIYTENQMEVVKEYGTYLTKKQIEKVEEDKKRYPQLSLQSIVESVKEMKYL